MKSQKIVLLESGCQIALTFLRKIKEPNSDQREVIHSLERAINEPRGEEDESLESAAAKLFLQPDIQSAFVQKTCSLDREPVGKVPGGAGAYVYGQFLREKCRAFVDKGDGKFAEGTADTPSAAVVDALSQIEKKKK